MANDIVKAKSANAIKNGSALVSVNKLGTSETENTHVKNTPVLSDIQAKYDTRFDDPRYYTGDTDN